MPVFINEVVFRANVQSAAPTTAAAEGDATALATTREALVAEVLRAVLDHLERELDRIGER